MRLVLLFVFYLVLKVKTEEHEIIFVSLNASSSELDAYISDERPWCPPSMDILPCTCDGPQSFLLFQCDRVTEIYSIARSASSITNVRNFGKFSLTNSRIESIEANILGYMRFEYIYMRKNTLKKIGPEFFDSSRESLKRIEIIHNDLEKFPFKELSSFPKLEFINLKYNSIKSIPDDAFGKVINNKIRKIDLSFNKINHVGSNAFKYLTRLEKLDFRHNKLTVVNNWAFSTTQENTKLILNLANNKIMFISDEAFQNQIFRCLNLTDNSLTKLQEAAFRGILKRMAERRTGVISVGSNRFRCTCDKVEWIVRLPTLYKLPILDFECLDKGNAPIHDMSLQDIGCTSL